MFREDALGVLLVHGIGEQPKGDTLLRFGEPIIQWIERWLRAEKGQGLQIERRVLTKEAQSAQRCFAKIYPKGDRTRPILFAESWWASEVRPPPFFDLAWWLLLVGTRITLSHAREGVHREDGRLSWVEILRFYCFYVPVAFSHQILLLVVWLLGSLPISPWRDFFSKSLQVLSGTIGDSYIVFQSPLQYRAALDRVMEDIEALGKHSSRIMVIAHSQGAKLAYDALKRLDQCALSKICFISVGAGLKKLTQLEQLDAELTFKKESKDSRLSYFLPIGFLLPWIVLFLFAIHGECWPAGVLFALVLAWGLGAWVASLPSGAQGNLLWDLPVKDWMDIYASSDPVPNGPLRQDRETIDTDGSSIHVFAPLYGLALVTFLCDDRSLAYIVLSLGFLFPLADFLVSTKKGPALLWPESKKIVNRGSLLWDHITYFSNWVDFIPKIIRKMKEFGEISWLDKPPAQCDRLESGKVENWEREVLSRFVKERRCRTLWLNTAFWLNTVPFFFVFVLIAVDIGNWNSLGIWGWLLDRSQSMSGVWSKIVGAFGIDIEKGKLRFGAATVLVFLSLFLFTAWVSVVAEKTINHQIFRATSPFRWSMPVCAFLTAATNVLPVVVWLSILYPLFGMEAFNNVSHVLVNVLLGALIVVFSMVIGWCYSQAVNKEREG